MISMSQIIAIGLDIAKVRFTPVFDEVFGITNDKQTVRPIEDFWRILALEEIDKQLGRERAYERKIRQEAQEAERRAKAQRSDEPTIAETAAAAADTMAGQSIRVPERQREQARTDFDKEVKRRAKQDKVPPNEVRAALEADAKRGRISSISTKSCGGLSTSPNGRMERMSGC